MEKESGSSESSISINENLMTIKELKKKKQEELDENSLHLTPKLPKKVELMEPQ